MERGQSARVAPWLFAFLALPHFYSPVQTGTVGGAHPPVPSVGWCTCDRTQQLISRYQRRDDQEADVGVPRTPARYDVGKVLGERRLSCIVYTCATEALAYPCEVFVEYTKPGHREGEHAGSAAEGCPRSGRHLRSQQAVYA
jgi:hypothetical protein